jgi:2-dehydropantoate 2-reductase
MEEGHLASSFHPLLMKQACLTTVLNDRNAGYSTICTLTHGSMADILAEPHKDIVNNTIAHVINEVIAVAAKIGVDRDMLVEAKESILARTKGSAFRPSMLVDLEAGRPIEVEVIVGDVVRTAAEVGVSVPRCAP